MIMTEFDGEELEHIIQEIPFSRADYDLIIENLKAHDVLALHDREIDAYDHMFYVEESVIHGGECIAHIDLNMLINILSVVDKSHGRESEFIKLGASFILFCGLSDIQIEPVYALHENPENAQNRLELF